MRALTSKWVFVAAVGGMVVAGAVPASAQSVPGGRRLNVQASARATYNSNVAGGDETVAALRNIRPEEITYAPSFNVDAALPFAGQVFTLRGGAGYEFHQYNKRLQSERINLAGGLQTGLGPCGVNLQAGIARGQSSLADLSLEVTENIQQTRTVSAEALCSTAGGLGVTGSVREARTSNSSSQVLVDSRMRGVSAGLAYSSEALGTLSLGWAYSKGENDTPSLSPAGQLGAFEQNSIGLTLTRPIGTRLTGRASIGYATSKSGGSNSSASGISGSGELQYIVGPRLQTTLSYERGAMPTLQSGFNYVLVSSWRISADYRLSSRIRTGLGARLSDRTFKGQIAPVLPNGQISEDSMKSVFASTAFSLGRRTTLTFDGGYDRRTTNRPEFNYSAYRAGVSISTSLIGN